MGSALLPPARRKVLTRFLLIAGGISLLLLAVELMGLAALGGEPSRLTGYSRWLAVAGLLLAGMGSWAFFSQFLFRRLLRFLGAAASEEDVWAFAQGCYGLVGVGIALSPAMAFFYYALTRDFAGSMALHGLAWVLLAAELLRFLPRTDELEEMASGPRGREGTGGVPISANPFSGVTDKDEQE